MACLDLFAWSPTSTVWNIAGHLALPLLWFKDEGEFIEPLLFEADDLSQLTGLTIDTVFQIFVENQVLFKVNACYLEYDKSYIFGISLMSELRRFLETESRSQGLHFAYRSSVIHELGSKFSYGLKASQLFVFFQLCS